MMRTYFDDFNADFTCKNCGRYVSARTAVSGVVNRNHCPYCLHSRHVDLFEAGDRLCACKGVMAPVGLTVKRSRDKYARGLQGELMLVHRCQTCGGLSINRIAADDDSIRILESLSQCPENLLEQSQIHEIQILTNADIALVESRLYGTQVLAA
ncbi:RNHCP domain-containing protein [Chloroflexota bacterium]|nr:RNHCP domain-containing protein [Chloroflexota bacterium]